MKHFRNGMSPPSAVQLEHPAALASILIAACSRNCTKHQVRCDYMDSPTAGDNDLRMSHQANLLWTPEIEKTVQLWRTTGHFPFPELSIFPQPQWTTLSKTDLRLIYHLSSISNDLQVNRTTKLTIWTELMPKYVARILAVAKPYLEEASTHLI